MTTIPYLSIDNEREGFLEHDPARNDDQREPLRRVVMLQLES